MTNTVSHLCGFADTTNTGPPAGTRLYRVPQDITGATAQTGHDWTWNASQNAIEPTADNALVTNVTCSNCYFYDHVSGATLQNSDIGTSTYDGLADVTLFHASNTTIAHSNIHGMGPDTSSCPDGVRDIYGDSANLTFEYNNVWDCADPLNNILNGGLIKGNYAHDMSNVTSCSGSACRHYEDIQMEDGGDGNTLTIQDNTFFNQQPQTATIILSNDNGGTENHRVIDHNLLAGGGYCFYGSGGPTAGATNITFTNNHFSRLFYSSCGSFGPDAYWKTGGGNVWSGNVWDDTGASVQPS
jgi:hypothetical protein